MPKSVTTGLLYEMSTEGGSNSVSVVPDASQKPAKFMFSGIAPFIGDGGSGDRNYLTRVWPEMATVFDPDAAGSAVSWDKLYKAMATCELVSKVLGTVYPHKQTRGAVLGHLIQVIGLGYEYPEGARTQIPASTDVDVSLFLIWALPMAHECLDDPMETAQWVGFFDGGSFEVMVAPESVYDGDYAGALIKAPTTLRTFVECQPSSREFIGVPFQWREREVTGGGSSPKLTNVGGESNLNNVAPGCGLAGLWWLANPTGIGLDGPDGVDNFTSIAIPWRSQPNILNLDGYFTIQKVQTDGRVGPIAGNGSTIMADRAGWPNTMEVTTGADGRPSANAQAMLLSIVAPGKALKTSKVQRLLGDLIVQFGVTTPITTTHRFVTFELMEFTPGQYAALAGLGRFQGEGRRAGREGTAGSAKELRYTAMEFDRRGG